MATYRDVLRPIIPDRALAEAEARTFDRPVAGGQNYACRDGRCALGVIWHWCNPAAPDYHFPIAEDFAWHREHTERHRMYKALDTIVQHNDAGKLVAPGSLTALLDSEMEPAE